MAKLTCIKQNIFDNTGPTGVLGVFGSYKAGAPAYSNNLETLSSLTGHSQGLIGSCVNTSAPAMEDLNSLLHSITRQIYYLQSEFPPEFSAKTPYMAGSVYGSKISNTNYSAIYGYTSNDNINQTQYNLKPVFMHSYGNEFAAASGNNYNISVASDYYVKITSAAGPANFYLNSFSGQKLDGVKILFDFPTDNYAHKIYGRNGLKVYGQTGTQGPNNEYCFFNPQTYFPNPWKRTLTIIYVADKGWILI